MLGGSAVLASVKPMDKSEGQKGAPAIAGGDGSTRWLVGGGVPLARGPMVAGETEGRLEEQEKAAVET